MSVALNRYGDACKLRVMMRDSLDGQVLNWYLDASKWIRKEELKCVLQWTSSSGLNVAGE